MAGFACGRSARRGLGHAGGAPLPGRPPVAARGNGLAVRGPSGILGGVLIRETEPADWAAIWPFFRAIVRVGETYTYPRDVGEEEGRELWMVPPPGRTVVAEDSDGAVLGSAKMHANHMGGGSHVATASFMVAPEGSGRGVGRALGEHVLAWARGAGYRAMQFNAVVESNTRAVALWKSLGFEIMTTLPEAFHHPELGYTGLHVMYQKF